LEIEKKGSTTNTNEIQTTIREYFKNFYSNELENLEEMDKFLDTYDQPKLIQEAINYLSICVTRNEIKTVIKSLPTKKSVGPDVLTAEFH
jgi:ubiquinone biosynthesis protein Coq4